MGTLFLASSSFTKHKRPIIGCNSSTPANQPQGIIRIPQLGHELEQVTCEHISIPQVKQTHEHIISRPLNAWGGTMGVNKHGLAVAFQPIYTKKLGTSSKTLTGEDLTRLLLERCETVDDAIIKAQNLLDAHGGLFCRYSEVDKQLAGHAFVLADTNSSWLLEVAGPHWAIKKIESPFFIVADMFQISNDYQQISAQAVETATKQKLLKKNQAFGFKEAFGHPMAHKMCSGDERVQLLKRVSETKQEILTLADSIPLLSLHYLSEHEFKPSKGDSAAVCKHATGDGDPFQTSNSMLAELTNTGMQTVWFTGSSSPCMSIFKPFFIPGNNIYEFIFKEPTLFSDESMWWKFERFHRKVSTNYKKAFPMFKDDFGKLQETWLKQANGLSADEQTALSNQAMTTHLKRVLTLKFDMEQKGMSADIMSPFYNLFIKKLNKEVTPVA